MTAAASHPGIVRGRLGDLPAPGTGEAFATLAALGGPAATVVIEEIASSADPEPTVYRQDQHEWVVLLAGAATLDVAGTEVRLGPGDWVLLPAGTVHRVKATSAGSRWLAVHVHP